MPLVKLYMKRHFPKRSNLARVRAQFHSFKYPSARNLLERYDFLRIEERKLGSRGVACENMSDSRHPGAPRVLFFHGGAYVMGSPHTHRILGVKLILHSKVRATLVDYRLAPEHPFPAAIEDCLDVYEAMRRESDDPIIFCGDSAGGGLVVSCMLAARDRGIPLPAAGICFSPWLDLTMSGNSIVKNRRRDGIIGNSPMSLYARAYAGETDVRHPWVSPIFANLAGLPPLLLQASSAEVLYSDAERFVARARAAGVEAELQTFKGQVHVFQAIPFVVPEARMAMRLVTTFIRDISERSATAHLTAAGSR
nr:esterase [uncultured bacterium]